MGFMGRRNRTSRMTLPRRVYGGSTLNYPSRRSYHVRPSVCSAVPCTRRTVADCVTSALRRDPISLSGGTDLENQFTRFCSLPRSQCSSFSSNFTYLIECARAAGHGE